MIDVRETVRRGARSLSDWVDLKGSHLIASLKAAAPRARGKLLDVGCGDMPYAAIFAPYVDHHIGVEYQSTFQRTAAAQSTSKPTLLYDGQRLPFQDKTFETVMAVEVLEHTPTPGDLVKEMARVCKPDGTVILTAPFQFRLHEQPYDFYRYSPHGLRHLCNEAGLEVIEIQPHGSLWSVLAHKTNTYLGFRVARVGAFAQSLGKLKHEQRTAERTRTWLLPVIGPSMVALAAAARLMDRYLYEPDEALGFLVVARPQPRT